MSLPVSKILTSQSERSRYMKYCSQATCKQDFWKWLEIQHIMGINWRLVVLKMLQHIKDSPCLSLCVRSGVVCFAWVFLIWRMKIEIRGYSSNKLDSVEWESTDLHQVLISNQMDQEVPPSGRVVKSAVMYSSAPCCSAQDAWVRAESMKQRLRFPWEVQI